MKLEKIARWAAATVGLVGLAGCGLNEIQVERASVVEQSKAIVMKLTDAAKIDQVNLAARGEVTNPEYRYEWFAGTGLFSTGRIQAVGVELSGEAMGAGVGNAAATDPDLREKLYGILQRRDISAIEQRELITQTLADWLNRKTANTTTAPGG
jgi:hypothetical protein